MAPRAGIYTASMVVWLMIAQRLSPNATLSQAVALIRTEREQYFLRELSSSARVRKGKISRRTGGYSQARTRLPLCVVEEVADRLNESILAQRCGAKTRRDVFVLDGTTVQVAHTRDNLSQYWQLENQHGRAHYPLVRICVATNPETGIATRPAFGAYNGPNAVSEIELATPVMKRLPKGSTVIVDRYFGCFRFALSALTNELDVICRLKEQNAASMLGLKLKGRGEQAFTWRPSAREQKKYPQLASSAVRGKLVWCPLEQTNKKKQCFVVFTTLDLSAEEVFKLYRLRWNVETDLRDMKTTLAMNFIDAKSPEMIAKEIILGVCAFNLIRHLISTAAVAAKLKARRFSFTQAILRIHTLATAALADVPSKRLQRNLEEDLTDFTGLLLPSRASPRLPEPRKIWPRGSKPLFAANTSRHEERRQIRKNPNQSEKIALN